MMMKSDEKKKDGQRSFDESGFFQPESAALNPNPSEKKEKTEKDIENLGALVTDPFLPS